MNKVWCLIGSALLASNAIAQVPVNVGFQVGAELLKDSAGTAMPLDGLVILAASTSNNGFVLPTSTKFFPDSDDFELARWDLHTGGVDDTPGVSFTFANVFTTGSFTPGTSPVQLYWFPGLKIDATAPTLGTHYGKFTDAVGHDGGDAWFMPNAGETKNLFFGTKDANKLFPGGGSSEPALGNASLTVIPEPSECAALFGFGCLAWAIIVRKIRSGSKA